jgi:hypothetical protein
MHIYVYVYIYIFIYIYIYPGLYWELSRDKQESFDDLQIKLIMISYIYIIGGLLAMTRAMSSEHEACQRFACRALYRLAGIYTCIFVYVYIYIHIYI